MSSTSPGLCETERCSEHGIKEREMGWLKIGKKKEIGYSKQCNPSIYFLLLI